MRRYASGDSDRIVGRQKRKIAERARALADQGGPNAAALRRIADDLQPPSVDGPGRGAPRPVAPTPPVPPRVPGEDRSDALREVGEIRTAADLKKFATAAGLPSEALGNFEINDEFLREDGPDTLAAAVRSSRVNTVYVQSKTVRLLQQLQKDPDKPVTAAQRRALQTVLHEAIHTLEDYGKSVRAQDRESDDLNEGLAELQGLHYASKLLNGRLEADALTGKLGSYYRQLDYARQHALKPLLDAGMSLDDAMAELLRIHRLKASHASRMAYIKHAADQYSGPKHGVKVGTLNKRPASFRGGSR